MRISDWSSDVCSSDLPSSSSGPNGRKAAAGEQRQAADSGVRPPLAAPRGAQRRDAGGVGAAPGGTDGEPDPAARAATARRAARPHGGDAAGTEGNGGAPAWGGGGAAGRRRRSEEHTSELQSLMRI